MIVIRTVVPFCLVASIVACSSDKPKDGKPMSPDEVAARQNERATEALDVRGRADLLNRLDSTLLQWHAAQGSARSTADLELAKNLADVLQATVYKHWPDVLDFLLHGDDYQKTVAAAAIGFVRPEPKTGNVVYQPAAESTEYKAAIEPLVDLLASTDKNLVQNALLGLWRLRDPETPLGPILKLLQTEPDPDVRANAALALTTILTPERAGDAIDVLLTATDDVNARVRVQAVTALGSLKHPASTGRLLKLLDDPYILIQANAARALGQLGEKRNAGALVTHLEQLKTDTPSGKFRKPMDVDKRRELLRAFLIEALEKLSGENFGTETEKWRAWWDEERKKLES